MVKIMHPESSLYPSQTTAAKAKPRYVYSISKPHGQSFRREVRLLLSKAKLSNVCIFHYKTTWSEVQKNSQTATERGEAKLRILISKTT